ncbi:DUF3604 domain-containing protein [Leptolyngbya sp. 15MV]|nr:DUF3604 domain-containing protein [Leptolyngbya sp. 15MV]
MRLRIALATLGAAALVAACADPAAEAVEKEAAVAIAEFPERPLWGDTHLHTDNSIDAFGFGTRLGPEDALKFARGEEVTATTGLQARLDRPLDFLVIADHSDGLGATRRLYDAPRLLIRDPTLRRWHDMMHESPEQSQRAIAELINAAATGTLPAALNNPEEMAKNNREIWTAHLETIDRYYEPGTFTPLAGFEYTLMPGGNNLHRVVVFRDGFDRTSQVIPFGGIGDGPVDLLWDYMDAYEERTGGKVLAIPHNSNLSNGLMFELTASNGGPMNAEYARRRALREPVVEVTQIKGDSEAHPFLSPNDELAGFGVKGWELGNLPLTAGKSDDMLAGEYVREALKRGLSIEERTGANPYAFGLIGSTDSHTSLATGDEDNFWGKHTGNEQAVTDRALQPQNLGTTQGRFGWHYLAGGYAAVWARANTRAEIFDALIAERCRCQRALPRAPVHPHARPALHRHGRDSRDRRDRLRARSRVDIGPVPRHRRNALAAGGHARVARGPDLLRRLCRGRPVPDARRYARLSRRRVRPGPTRQAGRQGRLGRGAGQPALRPDRPQRSYDHGGDAGWLCRRRGLDPDRLRQVPDELRPPRIWRCRRAGRRRQPGLQRRRIRRARADRLLSAAARLSYLCHTMRLTRL